MPPRTVAGDSSRAPPTDTKKGKAAASGHKGKEEMKNSSGGVVGGHCHQCRHKLMDLAASCNNMKCNIKFCLKCLSNRYGEEAEDIAHDWRCPKCRNICNCSVCRKNRGQQSTGKLFPKAKAKGFSSVSELLGTKALKGLDDSDQVEKSKIEEEEKLEEQEEKSKRDNEISTLRHEIETTRQGHEKHCMQMKIEAEETKTQLEKKIMDLEVLLTVSSEKVEELVSLTASNSKRWRKKGAYERFIDHQFRVLQWSLQKPRYKTLSARRKKVMSDVNDQLE